VILNPSSSVEVAQALALCRSLGTKFSIRGGGHLQNPGFTSNDGGVVISMSRFTQLVVSEDKSTVDVGLGLRWLDVYKGLDPYGITVAGGRVPPVGVPGLLLGGGLSFQNSEYGLGCTNVVEYEVSSFRPAKQSRLMTVGSRSCWQIRPSCAPLATQTPTYSGRLKEAAPIMVSELVLLRVYPSDLCCRRGD
jgi:hypothetical protein